jgi:DNA repair protein RecO (recombination protein O)
MAGPVHTEAVVLRSIRYGEADRILHLYSVDRGRISAIAKGSRRSRSRFGGRLEPFFRLRIDLHEGRSDLLTVTGAETVSPFARLREDADAISAAARGCDAVSRLFDTGEPHPEVFNLLCTFLSVLDEDPGRSGPALQVAFRLKLLLAAGLAPQLRQCARCGATEAIAGFSPAAGGVVCSACEAGSFALDEESHRFLTVALGTPLSELPDPSPAALAAATRAVDETAEHHGHVKFRPAA